MSLTQTAGDPAKELRYEKARRALAEDRIKHLRNAISRALPYLDGAAHEIIAKAYWDDGDVHERREELIREKVA
jgi:hypothetical protein